MKSKIPTIFGVFILIVGVAVGVFLLQQQQIFRLGASPDKAPKEVKITNITDNSVTITWITDKETSGFVEWGSSPSNMKTVAKEEGSIARNAHSVTIRNLPPSKEQYFKINSAGLVYDDSGSPWKIQTGSPLSAPSTSSVISGTVLTPDGQPAANLLVYANISGVSPLSAITSANGKWLISLSTARTDALNSYAQIGESTLVELFVQGGPLGIATAQIFPKNANPTPDITLGKVHDFRNSEIEETESGLLESELTLPEEEEGKSRFDINEVQPESAKSVTLISVDEGETIFTTKPEFFGAGPKGETITVTVESDPVTDQVTVPSNGTWRWSPPTNLEEGEHKITINWRDELGVLRTLTKSFTVKAADSNDPAFVSTPSATPKTTATPKASATPKPTASATPSATPKTTATPKASASATPRVSIPATDSGIPQPGSPLPSYVFLGFGIILLTTGGFLSFRK